jgi:PhnB protein
MLTLHPTIGMKDNAREALAFYQAALGGKVGITTYADYKATGGDVADEHLELVTFGSLLTDTGLRLTVADTTEDAPKTPSVGVSLGGSPEDVDYLKKAFEALSEGAEVSVPFAAAEWAEDEWWGMLTDKFGVTWEFGISPENRYV